MLERADCASIHYSSLLLLDCLPLPVFINQLPHGAPSLTTLNSQDSVPKFLKESRYQSVLREHNFDHVMVNGHHSPSTSTLPERTLSRNKRGGAGG